MTARVLYLIHRSDWTSSRIADVMRAIGYVVDFLCHPDGEPLPEDTETWAAIVIGGGLAGSMVDHERWPWLAEEIDFVRRAVEAGKPVLGLCLGAHEIALAFGGSGGPRADGAMELGLYPLEATKEGRDTLDGLGHVYQAHFEGIEVLPEGAVLLARSEVFPVQGFRYRSAIGLQGHPDAKLTDLRGWIADNAQQAHRSGIQPADEQLRLAEFHDPAIQAWTERFLAGWIGPAKDRAAA